MPPGACETPPCNFVPTTSDLCVDSTGQQCDPKAPPRGLDSRIQCGCNCRDLAGNVCVPPELIPKKRQDSYVCVCDNISAPPGVTTRPRPGIITDPNLNGRTEPPVFFSSSKAPIWPYIVAGVAGGVCLLLIIAIVIVAALMSRRSSPQQGGVAMVAPKDTLVEGNPLFQPQVIRMMI